MNIIFSVTMKKIFGTKSCISLKSGKRIDDGRIFLKVKTRSKQFVTF